MKDLVGFLPWENVENDQIFKNGGQRWPQEGFMGMHSQVDVSLPAKLIFLFYLCTLLKWCHSCCIFAKSAKILITTSGIIVQINSKLALICAIIFLKISTQIFFSTRCSFEAQFFQITKCTIIINIFLNKIFSKCHFNIRTWCKKKTITWPPNNFYGQNDSREKKPIFAFWPNGKLRFIIPFEEPFFHGETTTNFYTFLFFLP